MGKKQRRKHLIRLLGNNSRCKTYLEKVQKAHSVTNKVKDINEAREEENKEDPVDDDDDDGPQVVGEFKSLLHVCLIYSRYL